MEQVQNLVEPTEIAPVPRQFDSVALTQLDLRVIEIARRDAATMLAHPLFRHMFGGAEPMQLADPRLEALRRFAERAWEGNTEFPTNIVSSLVGAGYRIEDVLNVIELHRSADAGARYP